MDNISDAEILEALNKATQRIMDNIIAFGTPQFIVPWEPADPATQHTAGVVRVPPGLTEPETEEYIRNYRALFGEDDDGTDADGHTDTPPARRCHLDGHVFVNTGLLWSYCKYCDEDGQWSREYGKYMAKHRVARRFDA